MESKILTVISLLVLGAIIGAGGLFLFTANSTDDVAGQAYDSLLGELETNEPVLGNEQNMDYRILPIMVRNPEQVIGHVRILATDFKDASNLLQAATVSEHGLVIEQTAIERFDSANPSVVQEYAVADLSTKQNIDSLFLSELDYTLALNSGDADGFEDADDELEGDNETLNKTKKICDIVLTVVNNCAVQSTNSHYANNSAALSVATQKNVQNDFIFLTDTVVSYAQGTSESSKKTISNFFKLVQRACYFSVKNKTVEKYNGTEEMDLLDKCFKDIEENTLEASTLSEQDDSTGSKAEDDTKDSNDSSSSQGGSMASSFTGPGCEEVEHNGKTCYWVTPKKAADEFDLLDGTDCENLQNSVVGTSEGGSISFGTGISFVVEETDENNRRLVCKE